MFGTVISCAVEVASVCGQATKRMYAGARTRISAKGVDNVDLSDENIKDVAISGWAPRVSRAVDTAIRGYRCPRLASFVRGCQVPFALRPAAAGVRQKEHGAEAAIATVHGCAH